MSRPQRRPLFKTRGFIKCVALSRHCPTGSRIALTAEMATHAAGPRQLQMEGAAADSVWRGMPWRSVACCSECAWSEGCTETAWSLDREGQVKSCLMLYKLVKLATKPSALTCRRRSVVPAPLCLGLCLSVIIPLRVNRGNRGGAFPSTIGQTQVRRLGFSTAGFALQFLLT